MPLHDDCNVMQSQMPTNNAKKITHVNGSIWAEFYLSRYDDSERCAGQRTSMVFHS